MDFFTPIALGFRSFFTAGVLLLSFAPLAVGIGLSSVLFVSQWQEWQQRVLQALNIASFWGEALSILALVLMFFLSTALITLI
ncbi:MAG: hypothetical protein N2578_05515, partial [Bdellovibrionaceae bacterium]|nr:hypothetical protein [Pseudobdellovibrionaceae bacterium]